VFTGKQEMMHSFLNCYTEVKERWRQHAIAHVEQVYTLETKQERQLL